ncbi:MAG: YbaB/EbfC family nucleoid-associated protein [Verrucomicrobiota bacterium]
MNIAKMMKQAQKMQADAQRIQKELADKNFEAEAGGGAVKAVASGDGDLKSISISAEVIKDAADDPELLEDLVLTAVQDAVGKGKEAAAKELGSLTSGMGIPGLG